MTTFTIVLTVAGQEPRRLVFSQPRLTIGREAGDLVVADALCSSTHAELLWKSGRLTYRDLNSTNGSFLLGQRIQQVELVPGSIVQIGSSTLQYEAPAGRGRTVVAQAVTRRPTTPAAETPAAQPVARQPQRPAASSRRALFVALGALGVLAVAALGAGALRVLSKGGADSSRPGAKGRVAPGGEATVKAVWFSGRPGVQVEGGTADITMRVSPNTKDGASVGVIEEFAGGTGNQWRTASWLAAFSASKAVGVSLIDHEYLVRAGGHIDGPSAGMLMTATMMALLRGKPLVPNTTMTGTINPDGSAGPVGGIVQKMGGAKKDGITRFGYPMGARNHVDMSDMSQVDLEAVGSRLGLEVKEIHDLNEAYEFLTGDQLPRPAPVDEAAMELDAETSQRLHAKVTSWKARLDSEIAGLQKDLRREPRVAPFVQPLMNTAADLVKSAQTMERSDLPAAALSHYTRAGLSLVLVRDTMAFTASLLQGDLQSIESQIAEASSVRGQVKAFGDELLIRSKKQSVGGQVNVTLSFTTYTSAANFADLAETAKAKAGKAMQMLRAGTIKMTPEVFQFLTENLILPIAYYHCAKVMLDLARDFQDLSGEEGQASRANLARLGREAAAYGSAAGAALSYFDALVTAQIEEGKGVTKAEAEQVMASRELPYLLAKHGVLLTESIKPGDDGPKNLMRLAAGVDAYFTAAGLVNKYYALGAEFSKSGDITLTRRKALTAQLEQARLHAREAAGRAKATAGFIPVAARLDYQHATAMREGTDSDKLDALNNYWTSAFWSELAATLASE